MKGGTDTIVFLHVNSFSSLVCIVDYLKLDFIFGEPYKIPQTPLVLSGPHFCEIEVCLSCAKQSHTEWIRNADDPQKTVRGQSTVTV